MGHKVEYLCIKRLILFQNLDYYQNNTIFTTISYLTHEICSHVKPHMVDELDGVGLDALCQPLPKRPKLAKFGEVRQNASNHQRNDALSSSSNSFKHLKKKKKTFSLSRIS